MAEQQALEGDAALEAGRFGTPTLIENDAFTLQGQGEETAKREREARDTIRANERAASMDPSASSSSSGKRSRKSTSSSTSSSSSDS